MIQEIVKLIYRALRSLFKALFGKKYPSMKVGEMGTHKELQEKYGLYAENRPIIKLDPANVPVDLRDLIPMAEKWGIGDDIIRYDVEQKAKEEEKAELKEKFAPKQERVDEWIDSFDGKEMPEEAAAFLYMALAVDEMQLL